MKIILVAISIVFVAIFPVEAQTDAAGSGRAIQFDGTDDYVDFGNIYDQVTFPLTISAWVYRHESNQYILPIFASQDNASVSIYNGFWFCMSATNLFFEYGDGRGDQQPAYRKGKSAPIPNPDNRWMYVSAVVLNSSDFQLYVNGHNVGGTTQGLSDKPMASDYPADVAKAGFLYTNGATHRFQGIIDEVRIWNRALTVEEIRESMCRRLKSTEPNLIGYWNFDEISGDEVKDLSPNGFHGVMKGNPTRVFSGAPVGDESAFLYTNTWAGKSLSKKDVSVSAISGNPYGAHIYTVNSVPSQTGGLNVADVDLPYYGVFLADDGSNTTFELAYSENIVCKSFQREDNSRPTWTETDFYLAIPRRVEFIPAFESSAVEADLGDNTVLCNQSSLSLDATTDPSGKTFLWNTGATTHNITVTTSGTYSVEVRQGCLRARDTIDVAFVNSPPDFFLGNDESLCDMEPRTLTIDVEPDAYQLEWQDGSSGTTYVATQFGTYWLKMKNACGYSRDTISFTKKEEPDLQVNLGDNVTFCENLPFFLLAHPQPEAKTFIWNTGANTPSISINSSGIYTVEVRTECQTDRDTIHVTFLTTPPDFSLGDDEVLCAVEPRTLKASVETTDFNFTWHDGSKEPSFNIDGFGTYWLKIENACGVSVDSITFTRKVFTDVEMFNFMSPDNNDDRNQYFIIDTKLIGYQLAVFNRWGKQVYASANYQNDWDGEGLPSGVYFYTINGECIDPLKGTLTIMR